MEHLVSRHRAVTALILSTAALCALGAGQVYGASPGGTEAETATADGPPTAEDASEFIARVEKFRREFGEYSSRVEWTQATNITYDTNWLATKVDAENTEMGVKFANEAKRFDDLDLPPEQRRKIDLIKLGVNVPAPERPGAAQDLSEINNRMATTYATGKIELDGEEVGGNDLEEMMGTLRDPARPLRPAAGRVRRGDRPAVGTGQAALRRTALPRSRPAQ